MSEIRNIIAVCMKYMFYFIFAMIVFAFIVSAFEYAGIKFIHIKSDDVYYIAALIVCISPFMWAFLFILGYLLKGNIKAVLLGFGLVFVLILSFFMKNIS